MPRIAAALTTVLVFGLSRAAVLKSVQRFRRLGKEKGPVCHQKKAQEDAHGGSVSGSNFDQGWLGPAAQSSIIGTTSSTLRTYGCRASCSNCPIRKGPAKPETGFTSMPRPLNAIGTVDPSK